MTAPNLEHTQTVNSQDPSNPSVGDLACLIIPLFNEDQVITQVVASALKVFPSVICVDDGSSDDSASKAVNAGALVLRHPINIGQGASIQTGFSWFLSQTPYKFLVTFDADGQHRLEDAEAMVQHAQNKNIGFVLGSRFIKGKPQTGLLRKLVLQTVARASSWRTGMKLTDAHNGLRVIRRDVVAQINLKQNRMAHASEIIRQLSLTKTPWAEYPVSIDYTAYSKAKGQSILNGINIITDMLLG